MLTERKDAIAECLPYTCTLFTYVRSGDHHKNEEPRDLGSSLVLTLHCCVILGKFI